MIVFIIIGVACGWYVKCAERQRGILTWLKEQHGLEDSDVAYSYQHTPGENIVPANENLKPETPKWILDLLGEDYFLTVTILSVVGVKDLRRLTGLSELEILVLEDCELRDLSPLENLTELHTLCLVGGVARDLLPLYEMERLNVLYLYQTGIGDYEVEKLQQALPDLEVHLLHRNDYEYFKPISESQPKDWWDFEPTINGDQSKF